MTFAFRKRLFVFVLSTRNHLIELYVIGSLQLLKPVCFRRGVDWSMLLTQFAMIFSNSVNV